MRNTQFPQLVKIMNERGETLKDIAELLGYSQKSKSQISRRLTGEIEFTISDVEILCEHYNMDFWELFKRKEN